ncbi:MAG TPA: thiol protease/hemagglutinin PrtT [Bacteroidales bacterium]|nr:thiol protease/hemagglutinin PrtT [Bacteroidales bacterium]
MKSLVMKKATLGWLMVLLSVNLAFAGVVPVEDARLIAKNLYFERVQAFRPVKMSMIVITDEFSVGMAGEPLYYVFNIGNNEGFVLVAADDLVYPVLGYAFTGRFAGNDLHPSISAQMELYEAQIVHAREAEPFMIPEIAEVWDKYRREQFTPAKDIQTVGPICKTTWDQGGFYNDSCPGGSVTGCVATAMAQVMKAFNWPPKGKGSYSYTHPSYGLQSANFGITTYKWSSMPNVVSAPNAPVAQLMYHCGVSVDMSYSPGGSGASMFRAKDALYMYFNYSPFIRTATKSAYTDIYWKILIRAQHMNGRPVMYSGPGHAFVCDGFQYPDHFHFNWGWGGSYDGYFYLTSLRPGGYNFTNGQDAIVDAYPDSASRFDAYGEGGIWNLSEGEQVQINPNPSEDGMVNLIMLAGYSGEVLVSVSDIKGAVKDQFVIQKQHEWSAEKLNLSHLGSGFYLVTIQMGNQTKVCKLLIQ